MLSFVPLHLHTEWSLLDGSIRIKDLVPRLLEYGYPGCAITDHGTLYGLIHFYKALKKQDLKPILGCEFYVAPTSRLEKSKKNSDPYHLILLAKNEVGYSNLLKLGSQAYLEGFYYRPRIDKELLQNHSEGLICLTACLEGEIPRLLLNGDLDRAKKTAFFYKNLFGDDFYLEVQFNDLPEQKRVNELILELAEDLGIKVVGTTDSHYLDRGSYKAHEVLLCIQTGSKMDDPDRFRFHTDKLYLPNPAELDEFANHYPRVVLENTFEILEKVNLELDLGKPLFPKAKIPEGETAESYLVKKTREGLSRRLAESKSKKELAASEEEYWKRLEMELEVIIEKGYASYFLIVSDFIEWARSRGIPVGPGRGSAAGALTSYALYITNLDPIRWGLLFERFLNKERPSLPDIDVDFCMERRDEVIEYVAKTYGQDYIAKIATFGSLSARQVIRDVGRVLGFKPKEVDLIAKMITPGPQTTLQEEVKRPEIQRLMESSPRIKELFEIALKLEGLPRHASIHAAGVVISGVPVVEVAPLMKLDEKEIVVQYDMKASEAVGLIKFDFLGLKTLTIINRTIKLLKEHEGIELDLNSIPLDDPKVFKLLQEGETDGIFQLESEGMKELLRRLKPTDFNDLIAVLALYRPGPLGGGLVDQYIKTKHGLRTPDYLHPLLEPILKETYGVIVYQEQVMEIARRFAGYTLGEADLLRRAIGKKEKELMEKLRDDFLERARARQISQDIAEKVFDLIEKFVDYGFNKSHAAAYALISYQTAYLKAHYPRYFLASILTYEMGKSEDASKYLTVAERMGIPVLPPDVNKSSAGFTVEGEALRLGLQAIKNVGEEAVKEIISKRPYRNFLDFCQKVDTQKVNQRVLAALIKAGAFDSLESNRAKLLLNLPKVLSYGQQIKTSSLFGQTSLLQGLGASLVLEEVAPFTEDEILQYEKEALSFYLTSHPMRKRRSLISIFTPYHLGMMDKFEDGQNIYLACLISEVKFKKTRSGEQMAILRLEDEYSSAKALVFPDVMNKHLELLREGEPLWIKTQVDKEDETITLIIEKLFAFEDLTFFKDGLMKIVIDYEKFDIDILQDLKDFLSNSPDNSIPIKLILRYPDYLVCFETNGLRFHLEVNKILLTKKLFPNVLVRFQNA